MKKLVSIYIVLIAFIAILIIFGCGFYNYNTKAVSKESVEVNFVVDNGSTYYSLASKLKNSDLIKSELVYKMYIKIFKPEKLEAGTYILNKNMDLEDLIDTLDNGSNVEFDVINITFREGLHMRKIADVIANNTVNSVEDVYKVLEDKDYLDELINTYWFIDESIKNKDIYYSLEGYLFPDTYQFKNKNVTVKEIFKVLLDEMDKKLSNYRADIENSNYSVHEILTMASIIELESGNSDDRKGVSGVFYNRLENGWSLGSDVTTYYAEKVELDERELYKSEFEDYNAYNTRSSKMSGKLPVGPICNPSLDSIIASINPTNHDYYYFVADKNGKTYFNKTSSGHESTISNLRSQNLWFEY